MLFLGMIITKNNTKLEPSVYKKPTDCFTYYSYHPTQTIYGKVTSSNLINQPRLSIHDLDHDDSYVHEKETYANESKTSPVSRDRDAPAKIRRGG